MFKKTLCVLTAIFIFIGLVVPQTAIADSGSAGGQSSAQNGSQGVTVQMERVDSTSTWFTDVLLNHGYEDWFPDNNSCSDYSYSKGNLQFIKVKIINNSNSDITLNSNNQLVLTFKNKSGKELGLKLYEFSAYKNIDKSSREYTFGSSLLTNKTIKSKNSWEIYGYTKWMAFEDLSCSVARQPNGNSIQVRLTEKSYPGESSDGNSEDRIHAVLKLYNEGNNDIDLDKIRIHYYFNMDGDLNKVAPQTQKVEGKVYDYRPDQPNAHEYVINTLPSVFINMGQYTTPKANCFVEIGFPSKSSGSGYLNYLYKFLRYFSSMWNDKFIKNDPGWLEDILQKTVNNGNINCSGDNQNHRWWWKWDRDYTNSDMNYKLSSKRSEQEKSHADIELEIIKDFIASLTGDTSQIRKFNQLNHYSYNPGTETDWDKVTVYYDGDLIWGKEPGEELCAPSNLKAVASRNGILLSWNEVTGAEGYKIWRKGPGDSDFVQLPQILSENTLTDDAVTPGKTYTYKVQAVWDNGKQLSGYSNEATATALALTGNGLYAEYRNWKAVAGSNLTNYGYDANNNFSTNYIMENTELAMSRVDPKIDFTKNNPNEYYKWGEKAPDPRVNADHYSVVWSGYVMPEHNENYTFYTQTDDGVKLYMDLNRNGKFEDNELLISNWPKHNEMENHSSAVPMLKGKKYRMRVEYYENEADAVSKLLWSCPSQPEEVVPSSQLFVDGNINIPDTPTNLQKNVQEDWSVVLTWDSVPNAEGYKIYQTDRNGVTTVINAADNSYTVPPVKAGNYTYSVSAWNEAGESGKSNTVEVTIGLGAPTNLQGHPNKNTVELSWDTVNTASGYKLYRKCDGEVTSVDVGANNKYTDREVSYGKVYIYYVTAVKNGFEGMQSNEISVCVPPDAPSNLNAEREGNYVKLRWDPAQGAQTYNVLRSTSQNGTYEIITSGLTGTSFTDMSVPAATDQNGVWYYYKVEAAANGVTGPYSNIRSVVMYPLVETILGTVTYNLISNSRTQNVDFVLGSYIPISFEMRFDNKTVNPGLLLDKELESVVNKGNKPFAAQLVANNVKVSVKRKGSDVFSKYNGVINKEVIRVKDKDFINIKANGAFEPGDVLKIEFAPKVSTSLDDDVVNQYNQMYQLKFGLYTDGNGGVQSPVTTDKNNKPIVLGINVVTPDKLD
ncbi:MAG TPA: PA14 domain-containing protein [Ruminiclostridium sp.]|nr:PA14 domain-containing protein [Ruminiclostridium sp.]